jgi:DNA-binding XRE family transcriptional regulator
MRKESSPTTYLDDLLIRADQKPHDALKGNDGQTAYVVLTAEHYRALREALHESYSVAVALDPDAEFASMEEMRLRTAGADLAKARKAKGWTQARLARKTGVPQSQISRIERNPDRTTIRTMRKLAKALGVDVRQLIKP